MKDFKIVKRFFVAHFKAMYNCKFLYTNLEALRIGDRDRTVAEETRINNFGTRWREHAFTEWNEFRNAFIDAAEGSDWPAFQPPAAGSNFVVPIALALTFLFIAQGLN